MWINKILNFFKRQKVTDHDISIFNNMTNTQLADIASMLNRWEWPSVLLNPEARRYIRNGRRAQLMNEIDMRVGKKFVNRRYNKDRMTDREHEIWWNSKERKILSANCE